jgi:formylglycine-generating enzyme required for sulfatase activity
MKPFSLVVAVALALTAGAAQANVFNMIGGQTSLLFVPVGDPGNAADTATGSIYGSVGYAYRMGEYDVTVAQYVQFLNAVAKTDTYGLYNTDMILPTFGITQSGSSGDYSYSIGPGYNGTTQYSQAANCPIFAVTWGDAARFCNWLQNGQPTGAEGPDTTETGAYTLNGDTTAYPARNAGATYFIPSENELYKAAYYHPSTNAYWTYPTQSNTAPSNVLSASGTNNANYNTGSATNPAYTDPTNLLTPVGAFAASPGPYGTFDMGGDVSQWNEGTESGVDGGPVVHGEVRGGSFADSSSDLASSSRIFDAGEDPSNGFRVASVLGLGDANGDGQVDVNDLTIVLAHYGQTGTTWAQGEFTGDGTVDLNDLTIVLANFGQTLGSSGAAAAAVPEPSTLVLIGVAGVGLLRFARRRRHGRGTA